MTRRVWLAATAALAACRKSAPVDPLPEALGVWRRTALHDPAPPVETEGMPRGTLRRLRTARYEGAGTVDVELYELSSSAAALEAVQKWRPAAGTLFFYRDEWLVVLRYRAAERGALQALVAALEGRLVKK